MKKPLRAFATVGLMTVWELGFWYLVSLGAPDAPRIVRSLSPTNQGIAAFLRRPRGAGYAVTFYALDPSHGRRPRQVGEAFRADGAIRFRDALWSRDGTLIAARADAVRGFERLEPAEHFVAAYDFRLSRAIGEGSPLVRKAILIAQVLARRGGPGKIALQSPDDFHCGEASAGELIEFGLAPDRARRPGKERKS